jgi:hypothetical protein
MLSIVSILTLLLVCASPVLLAVLILKMIPTANKGKDMTQRPSVSLFQNLQVIITRAFAFLLVVSIAAFVLWWLLPFIVMNALTRPEC